MIFSPLLAAGWEDLFKFAPIIVAVLVWVISHFAGQAPQKPPQKVRPAGKPLPPAQPKPANDPLQAEIDEFLKQAQAVREGKAGARPIATSQQPLAQGSRQAMPPATKSGETQPSRPARRSPSAQPKRGARRDETRPTARPVAPPVVVEVAAPRPVRESVAQHVAETLDSSKFTRRATQLSQVRQASDAEFQQHMQRVFQHDLGRLKKESAGIFEAAGATEALATAAAAEKATVSAAGAQSATAPMTIRQGRSDIALFLAGRKNIRDAIILTEILQRPEHRW